jgi:rod shape-determining protein MreC
MPLGTLDRTPPPFFRQGHSALSKLVFFSALAVFLMVADARFRFLEPGRAVLAIALLPLQRAVAVPLEMWAGGGDYLRGLRQAQSEEHAAKAALTAQSDKLARAALLTQENERLRGLLALQTALTVRSVAAEVLYEAADPYSRKVFINRGSSQAVALGAPVVNEAGVLGQVTRVYALTSEVTLLTDKDAAVPVINTRTRQRSAAFGGAAGAAGVATGLELRYISGNADLLVGDVLQTSGLDGIYPPGLPVARVASVERRAEAGFARVLLAPAAAIDDVRHVLVLEPLLMQLPARPAPVAPLDVPRGERGLRAPKKASAP